MNSSLETALASMSLKDKVAIMSGFTEFGLGKDSTEQAELDFIELAELVANGDQEAKEILLQPSPWNYSINLLAKHIGSI